MSLVSLLPRVSFVERLDIDALRPFFEAIGASDEFADARSIDVRGNEVAVSWNDAGGAMLSAFGAHVLMRSRWVRGLAPQEAELAHRDRFGVFRGRLGRADARGVAVLAVRASDPEHLALGDLSPTEIALRTALTEADGGCRCPFCAKYSFSEAEAEALAAGAKTWKLPELLRLLRMLVPSERLVEAFLTSNAKILTNRAPEVISHFARVAPGRALLVAARFLETASPMSRARAARLWLRSHRTLGLTPDPVILEALRRGPAVVASAVASELGP